MFKLSSLLIAVWLFGSPAWGMFGFGTTTREEYIEFAAHCNAVCKISTPHSQASGVLIQSAGRYGVLANQHSLRTPDGNGVIASIISLIFQSGGKNCSMRAINYTPINDHKFWLVHEDMVVIELDEAILLKNIKKLRLTPMKLCEIEIEAFSRPIEVMFAGYGKTEDRAGFVTTLINEDYLREHFHPPVDVIEECKSKIAEYEERIRQWQTFLTKQIATLTEETTLRNEVGRIMEQIDFLTSEIDLNLAYIHNDYYVRFKTHLLYDTFSESLRIRGTITEGDSGGAFYIINTNGEPELVAISAIIGLTKEYFSYPIMHTLISIPVAEWKMNINKILHGLL